MASPIAARDQACHAPGARVFGYDEYNLRVLSRFLHKHGFTVTCSSVSANVKLIQAIRRL